MQINLKDSVYSALKTLADKQSQGVETYLEQLIRREVGKYQSTIVKDSQWATLYSGTPRYDSAEHDPQVLRQAERDIAKLKESNARDSYIERLRSSSRR